MAYVPLDPHPKGLVARLALKYSTRRFGRVVEPALAACHHAGVLVAAGAVETAAEKGWRKLDGHLRHLAIQAVSGQIGCSWCIDYGHYEGIQQGIDPRKVRDVGRFATSDVYTDVERAVIEYAVAATATPAAVDDALMERLHAHLDDAEIVELAAWVALENYRSRFNAGLGLKSQGFSDSCEVPPDR
ncbi:MAG: carboxymuconolactone decarboxylase family protein [Acidimicrobiales bacterium]